MTRTMVRITLFFALSIVFFSCSTDFDLTTGEEERTVVYGLLNEEDFEHLIRVEKMFVDEDIPPRELAKQESEVFHNNILVTLSKIGEEPLPLERINLSERGSERDSGLLLTDPNYVYRVFQSDINLGAGDSVVLKVLREDSTLAEAGTSIVGPTSVSRPRIDRPLTILPPRSLNINWSDNENAAFYDLALQFEIRERQGGEENTIFLKWIVATGLEESSYSLDGSRMYNFLASELTEDPTITRRVERIDIEINSGGQALKTFLDIARLNTGIISSQVQPDFSNVKNGLGLLSSQRTSIEPGYVFSQSTIDSLQSNRNTENLNFR